MNPGQDGSGAEFVCNLALAQDLSSQIHGMLRLAHRRARTLDGELASEIASAADTASNLVYFLSSSLFAAEPRAGESADYLDVLIQRLSDFRIRASNLVGSLTEGSQLTIVLEGAVQAARAQNIEHILAKHSVPLGKTSGHTPAHRIAPAASRLAAATARLLPASDRERFHEEFRSELWDLAAAGMAPRRQIAHALSQLRCAVPLRFAVLSPRRRRASQ